ncbi:unnamed protein product [Ceutorhynchus assimilis]|uniref:MADF domain-containing protein n=1 Tax=Ceutorhynchus assimilis TaxID=467358 RepID=A0A9N9MEJ7_9CUCU|nr:unnamed protein product [Ceutorhynchus assimilis]
MDDGLLIEQVAGFPALFNKNDCRFKNKTAREQAWQTIAEIMGCSVEDCSNRWVVLRAKYTTLKKQIRETPSGSAGFSISWPHYEAMGFLDPFLVTRRTISNIKLKYQNISNLESSEQGQGPSSIWDTMSQLEFSDVSVGAPETEDSVTEVTDETDFSPPPTPDPISKSGLLPHHILNYRLLRLHSAHSIKKWQHLGGRIQKAGVVQWVVPSGMRKKRCASASLQP